MLTKNVIQLTRKELYDEVWTMSARKVSKKYNVPYGKFLNLCKENDIPIPPSGYWTKLDFGKPVTKTGLSGLETLIISLPIEVANSEPKEKKVENDSTTMTELKVSDKSNPERELQETKNILDEYEGKLPFLLEEERKRIFVAAKEIKDIENKSRVHKKILSHKKVVKEWNEEKDIKPEYAQRSLSNFSKKPHFLAGTISKDTLPRVYIILDKLYRQIEKLGGTVNDDLSLQIRNERVEFDIVEAQDKVDHVLSKKEAREIVSYEDRKWGSRPQIRKYDYIFNGKLKITIDKGKYFRDSDTANVEEKLDEIFVDLYEKSEVVRKDRLAKEEAERQWKEKQRLKEERKRLYKIEVEKTLELENEALDYEKACKIRSYIRAVESAGTLTEEGALWVQWAKYKADWYDPIIAREDELLGIREHEKDEERKQLKKPGFPWW